MAFDTEGQADTADRKFEICERSYRILVDEIGFPPEDIIFDPNIFAVATGIEEHDNYAVEFIEGTRRIKQNLPHCKVVKAFLFVRFLRLDFFRISKRLLFSFLLRIFHSVIRN